MQPVPTLVSAVLLATSLVLVALHRRAWNLARRRDLSDQLPDDERDFARNQFRRRMQTSVMVGLIGAAIFVGQWIRAPLVGPLVVLFFWCGVVLVVLWIILLALADAAATRLHFARLRQSDVVEHVRLQAQLVRARRQRRADQNGSDEEEE